MVHGGHMTIVPRDRDRVPTRSRDSAAISGITSPPYSIALPELLGFGSGHVALQCLRAGDGLSCILMIPADPRFINDGIIVFARVDRLASFDAILGAHPAE